MNQILSIRLEKDKKTFQKKNWFKFQFIFSLFIIMVLILCSSVYLYHLGRQEDFSNNLIANYNIYKLYNTSKNSNQNNMEIFNGLFRNY